MNSAKRLSGRAPLVLSLGDPAGLGPELIACAWVNRKGESLSPFAVVGDVELLQAAAATRGLDLPVSNIGNMEEAVGIFPDALPVIPIPAGITAGTYAAGKPSAVGARAALKSLEHATRLTISGHASALVTAPVAKTALADVGFDFPGQTEFLASRCNISTDKVAMLLAGPNLRTVPVTIHCALSEVSARLSSALIERRARVTAAALRRDFGIDQPRLAIAGLNPHAGENGTFGDEEARIIIPAITALRNDGISVSGPHAADALFAPHKRNSYDVAICMYHDQALIPIKALDFDQGVNLTLGLPIIRTSPDHGTAFDIAGKNIASPSAMIAAIRMAGQCAQNRQAQKPHPANG